MNLTMIRDRLNRIEGCRGKGRGPVQTVILHLEPDKNAAQIAELGQQDLFTPAIFIRPSKTSVHP